MKKVFFVFGIRFLSKKTLMANTHIGVWTYDHFSDAHASMSYVCDTLRKEGHVIVKAQVFKKVIEL